MNRAGWLVLLGLCAQAAPVESLRGHLLEQRGSKDSGEFSLRTSDFHVEWFHFDTKTLCERMGRPVSVLEAVPGDLVEVVSEGKREGRSYARLVRVVEPLPQPRRSPARASRTSPAWEEELFPRGNLTIAGLVVRVEPAALVVRSRPGEEKRIALRTDTRYMADGRPAGLQEVRVNTRVFVRASETFDKQLQAHQVVWGKILDPR